MAIPAYRNITSYTIDVPVDSGGTQRVPPGKYVRGVYFVTVFDAHTTTSPIDGTVKTFAADPNWAKFAASGSDANLRYDVNGVDYGATAALTDIVIDKLAGYGNRLELVDVPATTDAAGIIGQIALDGTTIYLCTATGTVADDTVVDHLTSSGGHTTITCSELPVDSITSVVDSHGSSVAAGADADKTHFTVVLSTGVITFGAAVDSPYTYTVTYSADPQRWKRGTLAVW